MGESSVNKITRYNQQVSEHFQACAANGKNYINFLRELLQFFAEAYERDPEMQVER